MALTHQETMTVLRELLVGVLSVEEFQIDQSLTVEDKRNIIGLLVYHERYEHERYEHNRRVQPVALGLLRRYLNAEQKRMLRACRYFNIEGSAGGLYRLGPHTGMVWIVERHGKRFYSMDSFCYHDPEGELPPADVTLGQLLLLLTDEPKFLAEANRRESRRSMWNGEYLSHMAQARRERAA